ncbi:hypothetical protein, partial [Thermococcus sibiricus]
MSWVVMDAGVEPDEEELADTLEGALNSLGNRMKIHT